MTRKLGYVRLSKDDNKSMSVDNQKKDLEAYDPRIKLYIDNGVSGESNLTNEKGAWPKLWKEFLKQPLDTEIVMVAFDRMGRKQGKVLSAAEDIIDLGGKIVTVRNNKTYDNQGDVSQDVELMFMSFSNEQYRKEVQKKTQRAIDELKKAGVQLGRRPSLTQKQVEQMRELSERGLGHTSIGRVVRSQRKSGEWVNTSPRVVKEVLSGGYVTRDEWERRNQIARLSMIGLDENGDRRKPEDTE